jgi:rubrerythrin
MAEKPEAIEEAITVEDALAIQIAEGTAPPGLQEIIEKATKTCPVCGEIKGDADVCPSCGMSESETAAQANAGEGGEPTTGGA